MWFWQAGAGLGWAHGFSPYEPAPIQTDWWGRHDVTVIRGLTPSRVLCRVAGRQRVTAGDLLAPPSTPTAGGLSGLRGPLLFCSKGWPALNGAEQSGWGQQRASSLGQFL